MVWDYFYRVPLTILILDKMDKNLDILFIEIYYILNIFNVFLRSSSYFLLVYLWIGIFCYNFILFMDQIYPLFQKTAYEAY
jgi:hypothetical protein